MFLRVVAFVCSMFCAIYAQLRELDLDEGIERALRENRRRVV